METCPLPSWATPRVAETWQPEVILSHHARVRLAERGATEELVVLAVRIGQPEPARRGLTMFRLDVPFGGTWRGRRYESMQVAPVVAVAPGRVVVVTVYTFYFPPEARP